MGIHNVMQIRGSHDVVDTENIANTDLIPASNYFSFKTPFLTIRANNDNYTHPVVPLSLCSGITHFSNQGFESFEEGQIMKSATPPDLMDVVREMTTLLIHRYRSPLTGIMGFVELLKNKEHNMNTHYIDNINNGLDELSSLLDDIEQLNRVPSVNLQKLQFNDLIQQIINNYPQYDRKRINFYHSNTPVFATFDKSLMTVIIKQIIDNALEHDIKEKSDIFVEFDDDENLLITNFGPPISNDFLVKMFYPFYTTKTRNMGLGLTRASLLAQAQNYIIELISNNEVDGITFKIGELNLPVSHK